MMFVLGLLTAASILLVVFIIRNELIFRHRIRRIDETALATPRDDSFLALLAATGFDALSPESMIFDVSKWSYRDFYPIPAEKFIIPYAQEVK